MLVIHARFLVRSLFWVVFIAAKIESHAFAMCPSDAFEESSKKSSKKKSTQPKKNKKKHGTPQYTRDYAGKFPHPQNNASREGSFTMAGVERQREILAAFIPWYKSQFESFEKEPADAVHSPYIPRNAHVSHVTKQDLITFDQVSSNQELGDDVTIEKYGRLAYTIWALRDGARKITNAPNTTNETKISMSSQLAILKGFAGLWSRGGGDIAKGTVPFNLTDALPDEKITELLQRSKFLQNHQSTLLEFGSQNVLQVNRAAIKSIVEEARSYPFARTPLELTLIQAALLSRLSGSYVSVIFWTGEHTHQSIKSDFEAFQSKIKNETLRVFKDDALNRKLYAVLRDYFKMTDLLRQKHIFGYQQGVLPIRYERNDKHRPLSFVPGPISGEGAGTFLQDLRDSFLMEVLYLIGVRTIVFQNAEVMSPIGEEFFMFKKSQSEVAAVVVPVDEAKNYKGGGPFRVLFPGETQPRYSLLEDSNVSPALRKNRKFFNTNTIFAKTSVPSPKNIAFEKKNDIYRVKINAGDVTLGASTRFLEGQVGVNYENLKTFDDYIIHGSNVVGTSLKSFEEMLNLIE